MLNHILLVEHDAISARSVRLALHNSSEGSFKTQWVRTCADGIERLASAASVDSGKITAILVDLFLPDSQGIETFDRLFHAAPHIPILILCAPEHKDIAQFAMQR